MKQCVLGLFFGVDARQAVVDRYAPVALKTDPRALKTLYIDPSNGSFVSVWGFDDAAPCPSSTDFQNKDDYSFGICIGMAFKNCDCGVLTYWCRRLLNSLGPAWTLGLKIIIMGHGDVGSTILWYSEEIFQNFCVPGSFPDGWHDKIRNAQNEILTVSKAQDIQDLIEHETSKYITMEQIAVLIKSFLPEYTAESWSHPQRSLNIRLHSCFSGLQPNELCLSPLKSTQPTIMNLAVQMAQVFLRKYIRITGLTQNLSSESLKAFSMEDSNFQESACVYPSIPLRKIPDASSQFLSVFIPVKSCKNIKRIALVAPVDAGTFLCQYVIPDDSHSGFFIYVDNRLELLKHKCSEQLFEIFKKFYLSQPPAQILEAAKNEFISLNIELKSCFSAKQINHFVQKKVFHLQNAMHTRHFENLMLEFGLALEKLDYYARARLC